MSPSPPPLHPKPLGVFDSGVGGLTVLKALRQRLVGEHILYLGDTARVPYGTKSAEVVCRYALKNAEFLMQRGIRLLVVACNTASAVALPALRAALPIPVVGVIEPGARAAAARTRGNLGVLGTAGTIRSGAYQRALAALVPDARVVTQACPLFVPLAEEGWTQGEVPRLVAERYLQPLVQARVDTVVLGCTHYPLLGEVIAQALGADVELVDSAEATADVVEALVRPGRTPGASDTGGSGGSGGLGETEFFVTDVPEQFRDVGARFLGVPIAHAELVDLKFA
ncbi:MAG: glutamate racemase [Myxococcaceae bacterium]